MPPPHEPCLWRIIPHEGSARRNDTARDLRADSDQRASLMSSGMVPAAVRASNTSGEF